MSGEPLETRGDPGVRKVLVLQYGARSSTILPGHDVSTGSAGAGPAGSSIGMQREGDAGGFGIGWRGGWPTPESRTLCNLLSLIPLSASLLRLGTDRTPPASPRRPLHRRRRRLNRRAGCAVHHLEETSVDPCITRVRKLHATVIDGKKTCAPVAAAPCILWLRGLALGRAGLAFVVLPSPFHVARHTQPRRAGPPHFAAIRSLCFQQMTLRGDVVNLARYRDRRRRGTRTHAPRAVPTEDGNRPPSPRRSTACFITHSMHSCSFEVPSNVPD